MIAASNPCAKKYKACTYKERTTTGAKHVEPHLHYILTTTYSSRVHHILVVTAFLRVYPSISTRGSAEPATHQPGACASALLAVHLGAPQPWEGSHQPIAR